MKNKTKHYTYNIYTLILICNSMEFIIIHEQSKLNNILQKKNITTVYVIQVAYLHILILLINRFIFFNFFKTI